MGKKSKRRSRATQQAKASASSAQEGANVPSPTTVIQLSRREVIQARYRRHNPREKMDQLIANFDHAPTDHWKQERITTFVAYQILFDEHPKIRSEDDCQFLKKIRKSKQEPLFFRFFALACFGWYCAQNPWLRDDAFLYFDDASNLLDRASEEEKSRLVDLEGKSQVFTPAGALMARERERWLRCVDMQVRYYEYQGKRLNSPVILGDRCEYCYKSRKELGVHTMKVCSTCLLAYYCSEECQKKAWMGRGHKEKCRRRGEFKENDIALIHQDLGPFQRGDRVRIRFQVKRHLDENGAPQNTLIDNEECIQYLSIPWTEDPDDDTSDKFFFVENFLSLNCTKKYFVVSSKFLKHVPASMWNTFFEGDLDPEEFSHIEMMARKKVDVSGIPEEFVTGTIEEATTLNEKVAGNVTSSLTAIAEEETTPDENEGEDAKDSKVAEEATQPNPTRTRPGTPIED